jgi:cell division protein FtsB
MVIVDEVFLFFLLSIELSNWRVHNSFWAQKKLVVQINYHMQQNQHVSCRRWYSK